MSEGMFCRACYACKKRPVAPSMWNLWAFLMCFASLYMSSKIYVLKRAMKLKQFIALFLSFTLSTGDADAQTLRTCGCKTWNSWKRSDTATKDESRRERRKKYASYRDECLRACKGTKPADPKKEESATN